MRFPNVQKGSIYICTNELEWKRRRFLTGLNGKGLETVHYEKLLRP